MKEQIREVIAEQLSVDKDKVTDDAVIIDDLGADSLDVVELIMVLEEEFDMEIADEDAQGLKTINDIVSYLEKNK